MSRLEPDSQRYAEAKEVVGGYAIMEARSPEGALAGARRVAEIHAAESVAVTAGRYRPTTTTVSRRRRW